MQKKLLSIIKQIKYNAVTADGFTPFDEEKIYDTPITDLSYDSRNVKEGALFFALPGTHTQGNKYIASAIDNGANAIIFQDTIEHDNAIEIAKAIVRRSFLDLSGKKETAEIVLPVFLKVVDARLCMAPVSDAFYDSPSTKLCVIGVTGTEGKSSTVSFIWQLLRLLGKKAGFVSTVQFSLGGDALPNPEHATTPEPPIIQHHLYEMVKAGCEYAVVESSSHGLSKKLGRLNCVAFDCAVFMNVTLEHLEFHKTFEQYRKDKSNLFASLDEHNHIKNICGKEQKVPCVGIVNLEDKNANFFINATQHETFGFMTENYEQNQNTQNIKYLVAKKIQATQNQLSFELDTKNFYANNMENPTPITIPVTANIVGAFNAFNIMAAFIAINKMANIPLATLCKAATNLKPIQGRMTQINQGQPFEVIVDYAHTPSSFEIIFPPIKKRCKGKLICLFGSGGERDLTKRPLQGKIASQYCDKIFLCDEDPRAEDPVALLEMISVGAKENGMIQDKNLFIIPDRKKAIREAFKIAQENDIILLLGKGHENSIIYKDWIMPYDEIAEAKKALEEMGYTK